MPGWIDPQSPSTLMAEAILVGVAVLMCTIVVQAIASGLTVQATGWMMRRGIAGAGFWHNTAVMIAIVLIALAGIFIQLSVWAAVVYSLDQFPNFASAFYYSANNFTTLGLDYVTVAPRWRLLAPLEAVNGVLMFGVTTAMLFTIMGRLADARTRMLLASEAAALAAPSDRA
jgi:hypothetical protein